MTFHYIFHCTCISGSKSLQTPLFQEHLSTLQLEMSALCSKKNPSLLSKTDVSDLLSFDFAAVWQEWCVRAPTFTEMLRTCVSNPSFARNKSKTFDSLLPAVVCAGSSLINQYNNNINACQVINGLALKNAGAKKKVFAYTNKLHLTCSYQTVLATQDKLAATAEEEVAKFDRFLIVGDNVDMRTHVRHMTSCKYWVFCLFFLNIGNYVTCCIVYK